MSIPLFKVFMNPDVGEPVEKVLLSGFITQGPKVEEFETKLKEYFQWPYILTLNSATSGLTLAVHMLNLKEDDLIISTPLTCAATNMAIINGGAGIKWVDVGEDCNISPVSIKTSIEDKVKGVMVVHWGGNPCDMDAIYKAAGDLPVIQDCAHAFGSKYDGKFLGTDGKSMAVYSLQAIKHLTTSDGGLIFLPNEELYERAKLLRWYGISREKRSGNGDFRLEPDITEIGYKSHMNDLNATIGIANLPGAVENSEKIKYVINRYRTELSELKNIKLVQDTVNSEPNYWIFSLLVDKKDEFRSFMENLGIMTSQVHKRNDVNTCFSKWRCSPSVLSNLDRLEKKLICIPCGWWLTNREIDKIIRAIKFFDDNQNIDITTLDDLLIKYPEQNISDKFLSLMNKFNGYDYSNEFSNEGDFCSRLEQIISSGGTIYVAYSIVDNNLRLFGSVRFNEEIKFGHNVVHVEDVVVDSSYRSFGFGLFLVKYSTQLYKERFGLSKIYKIIIQSKDELFDFYLKCGFKKEGIHYTMRL